MNRVIVIGNECYGLPTEEPSDADMAIRTATQAIHDLYEHLSEETADWLVMMANIDAKREARIKRK